MKNYGSIEVIAGPMFSGKSEELIRRVRRARIAGLSTAVFKHYSDDRYSCHHVVSHSEWRLPSQPIKSGTELLEFLGGPVCVVAVDEAQFFDDDLVPAVKHLVAQGSRIIIAGLDLDYRGEPFGPMPQLLAMAEEVTKVHAICVRCGANAHFSQRLVDSKKRVLIGAAAEYEARCRHCFVPGGKTEKTETMTRSEACGNGKEPR